MRKTKVLKKLLCWFCRRHRLRCRCRSRLRCRHRRVCIVVHYSYGETRNKLADNVTARSPDTGAPVRTTSYRP